jgi:hypothetical protein
VTVYVPGFGANLKGARNRIDSARIREKSLVAKTGGEFPGKVDMMQDVAKGGHKT